MNERKNVKITFLQLLKYLNIDQSVQSNDLYAIELNQTKRTKRFINEPTKRTDEPVNRLNERTNELSINEPVNYKHLNDCEP